jgi:hypothetical protein
VGHVLSMVQNSPKFQFLKILHCNGVFDFCHTHTSCTLVPKVCVTKILGQKNCLGTPYVSLNFFFLRDIVLNFFPRLGRNPKTCSNLTCYAKNSTLVMYLSIKNQTFNMNLPLSYNYMFKWGVPFDSKRDYPFWYPNHTLTPSNLPLAKANMIFVHKKILIFIFSFIMLLV